MSRPGPQTPWARLSRSKRTAVLASGVVGVIGGAVLAVTVSVGAGAVVLAFAGVVIASVVLWHLTSA